MAVAVLPGPVVAAYASELDEVLPHGPHHHQGQHGLGQGSGVGHGLGVGQGLGHGFGHGLGHRPELIQWQMLKFGLEYTMPM